MIIACLLSIFPPFVIQGVTTVGAKEETIFVLVYIKKRPINIDLFSPKILNYYLIDWQQYCIYNMNNSV